MSSPESQSHFNEVLMIGKSFNILPTDYTCVEDFVNAIITRLNLETHEYPNFNRLVNGYKDTYLSNKEHPFTTSNT